MSDAALRDTTTSDVKSEVAHAIERLVREFAPLQSLAAPAYVLRAGLPEEQGGLDALEHRLSVYRRAFPDLSIRVVDQLMEGQRIVSRVTMTGTHEGPLFIFPPSGRRITMTAYHWMRFCNQRIVEHWLVESRVGMLQQLGFLPPPEEEFIEPATPPDEWQYGPSGSLDANKALAIRLIEQAWDEGDVAVCEEIVAEDAIDHDPFPGEPWGRPGIVSMLKEVHRGFDYHERVADIIGEGERVALRREITLHHRDRYFGIPATNRTAQMRGIAVFRIRENMVVERWGEFDMLNLLVGLGVVPMAMLKVSLPTPAARVVSAVQQRVLHHSLSRQ